MGEYAVDKRTGESVKIGTCESMYYLRYEDRAEVEYNFGDYSYFWRLPFPDEDAVQIGHYDPYERGIPLYIATTTGAGTEADPYSVTRYDYFADPETLETPGNIQLRHESGLLLNVPCYHGAKLPEIVGGKAFWNGKNPASYELAYVKNTREGVFPVVRCRWCGRMWRYTWAEVLPYIPNEVLRERLSIYA